MCRRNSFDDIMCTFVSYQYSISNSPFVRWFVRLFICLCKSAYLIFFRLLCFSFFFFHNFFTLTNTHINCILSGVCARVRYKQNVIKYIDMQAIVRAERVAGMNANGIKVSNEMKIRRRKQKGRQAGKHIVSSRAKKAQLCVCVAKITFDVCSIHGVGHTRNELMRERWFFFKKQIWRHNRNTS